MCPRLFTLGPFSLPLLGQVGPLSMPTYGLLVAAGFVVGLYFLGKLAKRHGFDPDKMSNLGVYVALAAIVGAKLFMILLDLDFYLRNPGRLFSLSSLQAGGVFFGGLLAAIAVAFWYARREGLPGLATADLFAPAVAIGHSIGRLGCFAAGCCWGKPTDAAWGVAFTDPVARELVGVPLNIHLHPTQLYEAAGTLAVGLILWRLIEQPHRPGAILGWYLVLYSGFRLFVEFFRDAASRVFPFGWPLSTTQWVAIALVLAGAYLLLGRPKTLDATEEAAGAKLRA
jgi:phosphatidylglycerol:prolipoprotein diacylglycerol transferase